MEITRNEIADCAMVGRSAVDQAVRRGILDESSVLSIVSYIFAGRLSAGSCLREVTGLVPEFDRSDKCQKIGEGAIRNQMTSQELLSEYHELIEDPEINQERLGQIIEVLGYAP